MSDRINMRDLAREAGVSQPTVSRALRNDPAINRKTRERIQQLAKEMGYCPNPLVSTLMAQRRSRRQSKKSANLAIISSKPVEEETPTTLGYINGAVKQAKSQGFSIEVFPLTVGMRRDPGFLKRVFRARGILGALILPEPLGANPKLNLDLTDISVVAIGLSYPSLRIDRVSSAHYADALTAVEEAWKRGYRRIGFAIDAQLSRQINHSWYAAILAYIEMREPGLSPKLPPLFWDTYSDYTIAQWMESTQPDAIITCGHESPKFLQNKKACPFLHLDVRDLDTSISGIEQDWEGIGQVAINALISKTFRNEVGEREKPYFTQLPGKWRSGSSLPSK